jgi:hypothetical protein
VTFQWVTDDSNRKILPVSDPLGRLSTRTRISLPSQIGRAPNPANMKIDTIGFCFYQAFVSEKFYERETVLKRLGRGRWAQN